MKIKRLQWLRLLQEKNPEAVRVELARCRASHWHFITTWCVTEDAQDRDNPHKLFPDKPNLEVVALYLITYLRTCVPKTRQMSLSWLVCCLNLWESLFFKSRCGFYISKKEEDAKALLDRTYFTYEHLPPFFHEFVECKRTATEMLFSNRSKLIASPQGEDQTRSYTPSWIVFDEAVFNEFLAEAIGSAIPAVGQHGKITLISSAGPSTFGSIVFDQF